MSANNYRRISRDEFESVLSELGDFEAVTVAGTKELVYHLPTASDDLVVRVYSSLAGDDDAARDAGSDAIRALLWSQAADAPVATAPRTNRIQTWARNFTAKVDDLRAEAATRAEEQDNVVADAVDFAATLSEASDDAREVVLGDAHQTRYGPKVELHSPYDAKDAIKSLDWDATHRAWDGDLKAWLVDMDSLPLVADHLAAEGWTLVTPAEPDEDAFDYDAFEAEVEDGDTVTIHYLTKTAGNEKSIDAVVQYVEDGHVAVRRVDDNHFMRVAGDSLYTARSMYPYVGEIVGVDIH